MATHSSILALRIPWTIVHVVAKSCTGLNDFQFHFQEKERKIKDDPSGFNLNDSSF